VLGIWLGWQIHRGSLCNRIQTKVEKLADHRPADVSSLEWAVLVYWTINLHGETIPQLYASYASLRELDRFLDAAIEAGAVRSTIDELWDRYAAMSPSGYRYSAKYLPIRDSIVADVRRQGLAYFDIDSYLDLVRPPVDDNGPLLTEPSHSLEPAGEPASTGESSPPVQ
jgi:hypothetical protein